MAWLERQITEHGDLTWAALEQTMRDESWHEEAQRWVDAAAAEEEQSLWQEYLRLQEECAHFAMRKVASADQIYPVFRDLFKKEGEGV